MDEKERNEHNAIAWLAMEDHELIRCSASLGLPANLHPEPGTPEGVLASREELVQLRKNADDMAREHAGDKFVKDWIKKNRRDR
jgi:hypothetical protein